MAAAAQAETKTLAITGQSALGAGGGTFQHLFDPVLNTSGQAAFHALLTGTADGGREVQNVSVLVAIGVNQEGYREILGISEGGREDKASWQAFLRHLKERGLGGVRLFISDKCLGLVEALGETYPEAKWQRCVVHGYRNVFTAVPRGKVREVAAMLKAIHAQEDRPAAEAKAQEVVRKLEKLRLAKAAGIVREGAAETLTYYGFPSEHWRNIRTNNPLERILREVRRRTRVVGNFPDGHSAVMLVAARLRHIAGTKWGTRRYLTAERLTEAEREVASRRRRREVR